MPETRIEPAIWNLVIYQGDNFPFNFRIKRDNVNVDLVAEAGDVRAQIRATEDAETTLAEFTVVGLGTDGLVRLMLSPVLTAALPLTGGVWDCEVELEGVVRTYFKGTVTVLPEVTR